MTGLDWRALTVEGEDRSAIYDESFPDRLGKALAGSPDPAGALGGIRYDRSA